MSKAFGTIILILIVACFSVTIIFSDHLRYVHTVSASMPYRHFLVTTVGGKYKYGDIVVLNPIGKSKEHDLKLVKRISAMPGDQYHVSNGYLYINDKQVVKVKEYSSTGEKLPKIEPGVVKPGHFLVLGEHENSYDSRYFGEISEKDILGVSFIHI